MNKEILLQICSKDRTSDCKDCYKFKKCDSLIKSFGRCFGYKKG